jgi:hypothetical protein
VLRSRSQAGFYYTLDIQPPNPSRSNVIRNLRTHILLIGAFLIEIGTGKLFKDINPQGEDTMYELEIPQTGVSDLYSQEDVRRYLIQNGVGDSYASAALHCFGSEIWRKCEVLRWSQREDTPKSHKEVLKDYYLNIFSP